MILKIEVISEEDMMKSDSIGIDAENFSDEVDFHVKESTITSIYKHNDMMLVGVMGDVVPCKFDPIAFDKITELLK